MDDCGDLFTVFKEAEKLDKLGYETDAINTYTKFIAKAADCAKALTETDRKHKLNERVALAYNNRGFLRYKRVDFAEAIEDYSSGVKLKPDMHFSYYNRGLIHYRLGRFDEAIADIKLSLALKADFEPALSCLKQAEIDREQKLCRGEEGTNMT